MTSVIQSVSNYLVPAMGSPSAYVVSETFTSTPFQINFSNISLNGLEFLPSGVIVDNSQSANPVSILIPEFSYNIVCPAGASVMMPYPAPRNHTASITGNGKTTVIFVDYPIIPYSSAASTALIGTSNVNVTNNPLAVSGPLTNTELRAVAVPVSNADISRYDSFEYGTGIYAMSGKTSGVTNIDGTTSILIGLNVKNVGAANGTANYVSLAPGEEIILPITPGYSYTQLIILDGTGTTLLYTAFTRNSLV